eukprot:g4279.t1
MIHKLLATALGLLSFITTPISAQELEDLSAKGKELYFNRVSCWVCHGETGEGNLGPTLSHGPTPMDIKDQMDTNPIMSGVSAALNPSSEDLIAIAVYIAEMVEKPVSEMQVNSWRSDMAAIEAAQGEEAIFHLTERDQKVLDIQHFDSVLEDWVRRAKPGSLKRDYEVKVIETYDKGEQAFFPEPNSLYFYENVGATARRADGEYESTNRTQVVVGNATTKEVITSGMMPEELRGAVHTTVVSPDAKYAYIIGPTAPAAPGTRVTQTFATMLKVDALTLQPIKQLAIGGRLHHAQVFQDKYLLMDTFISEPDGLDVFLFDPETDQIIGGIKASDLGGDNYTAYTDDEFIYLLMEPGEWESAPGDFHALAVGEYVAHRPYWVAKIDPTNWEVVAEYPYRGYRGDWIIIDSNSEYLYVPAASSSTVTKINIDTGEIAWSGATGIGPYGGTLNADETELWIANKGEATGAIGRTLTVVEAASGRGLETVFSGYMVDHVLLSPDGTEMWATSNGEGRIYVFDAETYERKNIIDMPYRGNPHGLVWVHYDKHGEGRVIRDQGGFHHGIHPAKGNPFSLE